MSSSRTKGLKLPSAPFLSNPSVNRQKLSSTYSFSSKRFRDSLVECISRENTCRRIKILQIRYMRENKADPLFECDVYLTVTSRSVWRKSCIWWRFIAVNLWHWTPALRTAQVMDTWSWWTCWTYSIRRL